MGVKNQYRQTTGYQFRGQPTIEKSNTRQRRSPCFIKQQALHTEEDEKPSHKKINLETSGRHLYLKGEIRRSTIWICEDVKQRHRMSGTQSNSIGPKQIAKVIK